MTEKQQDRCFVHYLVTMVALNTLIDKKLRKHYIMNYEEFKTTPSKQTGKLFIDEWNWKYGPGFVLK